MLYGDCALATLENKDKTSAVATQVEELLFMMTTVLSEGL